MATSMKGSATCHGAATIINGIVTGKGASFGIRTKTTAEVTINNEPGRFDVQIIDDPGEDVSLSRSCVYNVLKEFGLQDQYGARIVTSSDIPISRGLKSSSTASNALVLATLNAIGEKLEDIKIINIGVDSSIEAKVSITGAFDDACASYFGGVAVTDNIHRRIIDRYAMDDDLIVLLYVPPDKIRKGSIDMSSMKGIELIIERAFDLAVKKNYKTAMTMNGLSYGSAMGLDTTITDKALKAGALGVGVSGTGPATAILCIKDREEQILQALGHEHVIRTRPNGKKAWMH